MSIKESLSKIRTIAETLPDDDPDKVEMMDIEGDYSSLMKWALIKRNEHISTSNAAKELSDKYKAREKSFKSKADNMKSIIEMLMDTANEVKFTCEVGTASKRNVPPKPIVTDESKLPEKYIKITKSVDKTAINKDVKDGLEIDGVAMDNGGTSLTIRI
jgi:hypothetical protein